MSSTRWEPLEWLISKIPLLAGRSGLKRKDTYRVSDLKNETRRLWISFESEDSCLDDGLAGM